MYATTLQYPDPNIMFPAHTESSSVGIGIVLSQEGDNGLRPSAYISRKLNDAEVKYLNHEQELLAIIHHVKE